jgi:hypothetical protein
MPRYAQCQGRSFRPLRPRLATLLEVTVSLYPFRIRSEKIPELTRKMRTSQRSGEIPEVPVPGPFDYVSAFAEPVLRQLRGLPPTCRFVLYDAVNRTRTLQEPARLNLSANYDLRMYGCNEDWNGQWIASLGWSVPLAPDADISRYVDKAAVQSALGSNGISFKKSASKSALLETARGNPACWEPLCQGLSGRVILFKPEVLQDLRRWADSVASLRWAVWALAAL